jgi:PAS domain S-box-containing protein
MQGWEVQMQTYEGVPFPAAVTVSVLRNSHGKLAGLRWLVHDITERVRTDEALWEGEKRFRSVAETASDPIIIFDRNENIVFWNQSAKDLFRYLTGETRGKLLATIIPRRFQEVLQGEIERVISTGESDLIGKAVEMRGIRKGNREFPIELSLAAWRAAGEVFFTLIVRDITERKRSEEEREQLILELQDALTQVKTLSGLLPICASCKKIRDDEGYWNQIETYIQEHSEAEFTHGICDECAKKLYPDIFMDDE